MLDPLSLLAPNGPITTTLFPKVGKKALGVYLERKVENAYDDARVTSIAIADDRDEAAEKLALHWIFKDVYIRMNAEAKSVNIAEKGTTSYDMQQIENMKVLSDQYLDELLALVPVSDVATTIGGTRSIPNRFVF